MESAVREAEILRDALKLASAIRVQRGSELQNAFAHGEFPLELAGVLVDVIQDAVTLHGSVNGESTGNTAIPFDGLRQKCANYLRKVLADMVSLQEVDESGRKKLVTTSDTFVLELVQVLSDIFECNVSVFQGSSSPTHQSPLNMFKPHVVQYLVQSLRRAAESHVTRNADYASCKKALLAAEEATVAARGEAQCELETQSAAHQSTLENAEAAHRIALANMETQLAQVRVDSSREAGVAQEEIQRLEGELLSQKAAHEAEIREQATMHASVTIVLQVELMETKRHFEQEKSKALEEFKRLTTRCAELEATNKELMRKLEEQSNERVERTNDQEEQSSSAQTSLTIRVPVPSSSSRSPIAAGSKRTIESTEDPARPQEFLQTTNESALPSRRALDLAKLPEIHADLSASNGTPEFFTRESISATLGGNARYRLHVYVADPTSLSVKHDIKWYLCLTVSKLGWLPSGPGKHGFLHMELDQKVTKTDGSSTGNIEDTQLHLFVGIGAGSPEIFQYYGMYRITNAPVLSPEEWEALPAEPKSDIVEKTFRRKYRELQQELKRKEPEPKQRKEREWKQPKERAMTRRDIRDRYASGEYPIPCMRLECVQFDIGFYKDLVEAHRRSDDSSVSSDAETVEQEVLLRASKKRRTSGRANTTK